VLSTPSNAQSEPEEVERWFQAEIIVFEIREKNTIDSQEIWPDDPGLPNYEGSVELSPIIDSVINTDTPDETSNSPGEISISQEGIVANSTLATENSNTAEPLLTEMSEPDSTRALTNELTAETATVQETASRLEQPFQLLANKALTLTEITATLDGSPNYVPILHVAWRQPVAAKEEAQTVYINSNLGQATLESPPALINIDELMTPPDLGETPLLLIEQNEIDETSEGRSLNTLDGTIRLHLGRYLHVEADLLYRSQTEPMENNTFFMTLNDGEQPQTLFRMHQTRRMRSGELHYFDHPMFGLLVQITPYELPEAEVEPETITEAASEAPDEDSDLINADIQ